MLDAFALRREAVNLKKACLCLFHDAQCLEKELQRQAMFFYQDVSRDEGVATALDDSPHYELHRRVCCSLARAPTLLTPLTLAHGHTHTPRYGALPDMARINPFATERTDTYTHLAACPGAKGLLLAVHDARDVTKVQQRVCKRAHPVLTPFNLVRISPREGVVLRASSPGYDRSLTRAAAAASQCVRGCKGSGPCATVCAGRGADSTFSYST